jgi:hypothetical protein
MQNTKKLTNIWIFFGAEIDEIKVTLQIIAVKKNKYIIYVNNGRKKINNIVSLIRHVKIDN